MSSYLSSIGPALGNHLWQSTIFAAAIGLLTLLLHKNQARIRFSLWLAASLKFLLPFSVLVGLGGWLPRPYQVVSAPAIYAAVDMAAQPFAQESVLIAPPMHVPSLRERTALVAPEALAAIWLCGMVVVLAIWCARWWQVREMLRSAISVNEGREVELLQRVERTMRLRRQTPLRLSEELMEPGVLGVFRPTLFWPQRLSGCLDNDHIEAILIHELMHVRRRDNLTASLHMVVEALFWFHPAVWWIERRMVEERERACDEAVVEMGGEPDAYAESLLKACRLCVESRLTCVPGITGADLSKRVRTIMTLRLEKLGMGRKIVLAAFGLILVTAPVAFGVMRRVPVYLQLLKESGPLPSFEVATIKPHSPAPGPMQLPTGGPNMYGESGGTARQLVGEAYEVPFGAQERVIGGPGWIDNNRYDVEAKIPGALFAEMQKMTPKERLDQRMLMLQSLLAERFKLKVHFEMREMPIYELVVAKGGPKLTPAKEPPPEPDAPQPAPRRPQGMRQGINISSKAPNTMEMVVKGMTLDSVTGIMNAPRFGLDGSPVVDKTGLTGKYDFVLDWAAAHPAMPGPDTAATESDAPPLSIAFEEQLGLKLVKSTGPVEVVVIDSIEQPSEN